MKVQNLRYSVSFFNLIKCRPYVLLMHDFVNFSISIMHLFVRVFQRRAYVLVMDDFVNCSIHRMHFS